MNKPGVHDRLEGNQEAIESRERYREIVRAMGEVNGSFVARFEIKVLKDGGCTLIATSSRGADCDVAMCELAVAIIQGITGAKVDPPASEPNGDGHEGEAKDG